MNSRGFTVVELIAAFSITMVISVFLFEVLIEVKDIYVETSIKTNIQEKTAIISKNIKAIVEESNGNITCSSNTECNINGKTLRVIHENDKTKEDKIIINNQEFIMPKDGKNYVKINDINFKAECTTSCYLKTHFTLKTDNLIKDYDYTVVYYYPKN